MYVRLDYYIIRYFSLILTIDDAKTIIHPPRGSYFVINEYITTYHTSACVHALWSAAWTADAQYHT